MQCDNCAAGHSAEVVEGNDNLKSRSNHDLVSSDQAANYIGENDDDDDINDDVRVGALCVKSFACVFGWREEYFIPDLTS